MLTYISKDRRKRESSLFKNSSQVTANRGTLNLSATDNSAIKADAGSGALSIAGGESGGISVNRRW